MKELFLKIKKFLNTFIVKENLPINSTKNLSLISENEIRLGDSIMIDLKNNSITFLKPFTIKANENLFFEGQKHIVLNTSNNYETDRPGYTYSIWLNPDLDQEKNPLKSELFIDSEGYLVSMEAKYDDNGVLIIPDGYKLAETKYNHDDCDHE